MKSYFKVSYKSVSYTYINREIIIDAYFVSGKTIHNVDSWESLDSEIAEVSNGVVKGLKAGVARIKVTYKEHEFIYDNKHGLYLIILTFK